jgi:hypothetical protein
MTDGCSNDPMVLRESEAIELLTFLTRRVRRQLDEPPRYALMALLTAADGLRDAILERTLPAATAMLTASVVVSHDAQPSFTDPRRYTHALDALCRLVAEYLVELDGRAGDAQ